MSEVNQTQTAVAPDAGMPEGHWTAPEIAVLVIIGCGLAIAVAALGKLFSGNQFRRS